MRRGDRRHALATAAGIVLGTGVWGWAAVGHAFTIDARRMAMGSAVAPGGNDLAVANVAYQSMPARRSDRGFVVPIPLGLVQLASDFPTFDASDPTFDVLRITHLALNPPFFLELKEPEALNGDISIAIARNSMSIQSQDLQALLPQEPIRVGSVYSRPLFGLGLMGARTYFAPVMHLEGRMSLDDPLYGVLAHGQPLLPNSQYGVTADGATMAGSSFNVGYSEGGWGHTNGDGLYVGAYAKYILGFGFGAERAQFGLATADTIFGDQDPLDVTYEGWTRYSRFGHFGNGYGFDVGVAYRLGAVDLGLGVRDLGSNVRFGNTEVQHSYMDEATGDITSETLATGEAYTVRLPSQTTLNVAWTGQRTTLAADLTTSRWGTRVHAGAERRVGWVALRGGLLTDDRNELQYAGGVGLGLSHLWIDLGLQTHAFAVTGERGLTLGTSLAFR